MKQMTDRQMYEYAQRILRLVNPPRMMSVRAATIVVEAAMFGEGCIEGKVRAEQQKRIDAGEKL